MRKNTVNILLMVCLAASACKQDSVQVYRVPKGTSFDVVTPGPPASPSPEDPLHWDAPPRWEEQPPGGMRFASFSVPGKSGRKADMSVVVLPGDAGGPLANVNRWRGQIGLAPLDEKALTAEAQMISTKAGDVQVVDFEGPPANGGRQRVLAGLLTLDGQTWFFKMTGDSLDVTDAKPSFLDFIKSLHHASSHS